MATVIICILTRHWVCYVRSVRPKSISTIFITCEEFVLCVLFLLVFWSWREVSASRFEYMERVVKTTGICLILYAGVIYCTRRTTENAFKQRETNQRLLKRFTI